MERPPRIWVPEAPGLIISPHREVLVETRNRIEGHFTIELVHVRTGDVTETLKFKNIIVNAGLNGLATNDISSMIAVAGVGKGTTTPAVGQTGLVNELARTSTSFTTDNVEGWAPDNSYRYYRRVRVFAQNQANDVLTEIGFFRNSAANSAPMWCRQLFLDVNNNPTSITKTSEYELRVTYEVRLTPPAGDVVNVTTINGVSGNVTTRVRQRGGGSFTDWSASGYGGYAGDTYDSAILFGGAGTVLGSETSSGIQGWSNQYTRSSWTFGGYVADTFYRDSTLEWSASTANITTLRGLNTTVERASYQHYFPANIAKTSTQKLVLVLRNSWTSI